MTTTSSPKPSTKDAIVAYLAKQAEQAKADATRDDIPSWKRAHAHEHFRTIAREVGVADTTARKHLRELEGAGIVTKYGRLAYRLVTAKEQAEAAAYRAERKAGWATTEALQALGYDADFGASGVWLSVDSAKQILAILQSAKA